MKKTAVFPGSFDPLTLGHTDIINRAIPLFDEIIIAIGTNSSKKYMFTLKQRREFIEKTYKDAPNVVVDTYEGLTIDYCKKVGSQYILRGLRNPADFEFEKAIAQTNRKMSEIETVFLLTSADTSYISSSIVRDILINKGDVSMFVPKIVTNG
jgi:pantetheine-phosphate adenylyltransferase